MRDFFDGTMQISSEREKKNGRSEIISIQLLKFFIFQIWNALCLVVAGNAQKHDEKIKGTNCANRRQCDFISCYVAVSVS